MDRLCGRPRRRDPRRRQPSPARAEPAPDRRAQSHVAGPVPLRRQRAAPALQQAVHGHLRLRARDREARLHAARRARPSGRARHAQRRRRGIPDQASDRARPGAAHQQPGELQGADHFGHQPADAGRRLGRDPRGRDRAAPAAAATRHHGGAGQPARHGRRRDLLVPRTDGAAAEDRPRQRRSDEIDRHHAVGRVGRNLAARRGRGARLERGLAEREDRGGRRRRAGDLDRRDRPPARAHQQTWCGWR